MLLLNRDILLGTIREPTIAWQGGWQFPVAVADRVASKKGIGIGKVMIQSDRHKILVDGLRLSGKKLSRTQTQVATIGQRIANKVWPVTCRNPSKLKKKNERS